MQASELKFLADKANEDKENPQIEAGYQRIIKDLEGKARLGSYSHTYFLSYLNVSKPVWQSIASLLRKNGYIVVFDTETTAWYSNTDYDQEDVVKVSWI